MFLATGPLVSPSISYENRPRHGSPRAQSSDTEAAGGHKVRGIFFPNIDVEDFPIRIERSNFGSLLRTSCSNSDVCGSRDFRGHGVRYFPNHSKARFIESWPSSLSMKANSWPPGASS